MVRRRARSQEALEVSPEGRRTFVSFELAIGIVDVVVDVDVNVSGDVSGDEPISSGIFRKDSLHWAEPSGASPTSPRRRVESSPSPPHRVTVSPRPSSARRHGRSFHLDETVRPIVSM
jgi:hypothetical protein